MKFANLIICSILLALTSCKPEFPNHGFVQMKTYNNLQSPIDTSEIKYYIWRAQPVIQSDGRLLIPDLYNHSQWDGFNIILSDYTMVGSYPISISGNQIGDRDLSGTQFPNDSLYGILNILEADSIERFLKASFNGAYIAIVTDTIQFHFTDGYMEVQY